MTDTASKKYFIQQYMQHEYLHGGVTCVDIEKILLEKGFAPVLLPHQYSFSLSAKVSRMLFLLQLFLSIERGATMAFIFPVYAKMNRLLLRLLRIKGVKLLCIVADIDGLRDGDEQLLMAEIKQLKRFRYFIVHNEHMASYVKRLVPEATFYLLDFFDYLVSPLVIQRQKDSTIVFAANLAKSDFPDHLHLLAGASPSLRCNLYGPGITDKVINQKNVIYSGVFKPYDLPPLLKGSFGLIWDGISIDTCTGSYGEYLRYNLQHKLSLYIISKLPVIVWEEAASAALVIKYKIGFTIKNMYEIEDKLRQLSDVEYRQMQINMQPLAEKISKGQCLGNTIDGIMKLV